MDVFQTGLSPSLSPRKNKHKGLKKVMHIHAANLFLFAKTVNRFSIIYCMQLYQNVRWNTARVYLSHMFLHSNVSYEMTFSGCPY